MKKIILLCLIILNFSITSHAKEKLLSPESVFAGVDQITNQSCEVSFLNAPAQQTSDKQRFTPVSIKIGDKAVEWKLNEHGVLFSAKAYYSTMRELTSPDPESSSTYFLDREILEITYDSNSDSINFVYDTYRFNLFYRDRSTFQKERIVYSKCLDMKRVH